MKIAIVIGVAMLVTACVSTGEIEGHKVRATAQNSVVQTTVTDTGIHAGAPQWFRDYFGEYLARVPGSYVVMAIDRKLRGAFYVYCAGGGCHELITGQHRSFKDVQYKHRALEGCREQVRREFPAEKPACAIYAIRDKIVWEGLMPWE